MNMYIKNFNEFLNEFNGSSQSKRLIPESPNYITFDDLPEDVKDLVDEWISEEIINWEDSANSEEEAESVQYTGENERYLTDIVIYPDKSFTPIIYQIDDPYKVISVEWEEDGEEYSEDFINYLRGPIIWLKDFNPNDVKGIADKNKMPKEIRDLINYKSIKNRKNQ